MERDRFVGLREILSGTEISRFQLAGLFNDTGLRSVNRGKDSLL
jgi:hypothetical protein